MTDGDAKIAVLVEDTGHGTALVQELRRQGSLHPIGIKPKRDKITRMSAASAKIEAGQVWLPHSAPWLDDFLTEMLAFPGGRTIRSTVFRNSWSG